MADDDGDGDDGDDGDDDDGDDGDDGDNEDIQTVLSATPSGFQRHASPEGAVKRETISVIWRYHLREIPEQKQNQND